MDHKGRDMQLLLIFVFAVNVGFAQRKSKKNLPSKQYDFQGPYCNGIAKVKKNKKWGFIDTTGAVIAPMKYDEVENFNDGLARVRVSQKGWGLLNTSGQEIVKPMFEWIFDFQNGKAKVKAGGQFGYIDRNGNLIR